MRVVKFLSAVLLTIGTLAAQQERVTRLISLHHVSPTAAGNLLSKSGVTIALDERIPALVVSGAPAAVTEAENLVKSFDIAPNAVATRYTSVDVEVLAYLIAGSTRPGSGSVPPVLQDVVKQLRAIFPYTSYALLDSIMLRGQEGSDKSAKGLLPDSPFADPGSTGHPGYSFSYRNSGVSGERGSHVIRLSNLALRTQAIVTESEANRHWAEISLASDLALREGQKAVVGKTSLDANGSALFLVVTARVIE